MVVDEGIRVKAAHGGSEVREPFSARSWDMSCCDESVVTCGTSVVRGPADERLFWVIPQTRSRAAAAASTKSTAHAAAWRTRDVVRARVTGEALYLGAAWKIVAVMQMTIRKLPRDRFQAVPEIAERGPGLAPTLCACKLITTYRPPGLALKRKRGPRANPDAKTLRAWDDGVDGLRP